MIDALAKIPKGLNIILFMWMIVGVYFVLKRGKIKDKNNLKIFFAVIGFMLGWRVLIQIITSRYATALIIPFTFFAAFFLIDAVKRRHILVRLVFLAFVLCTAFIYLKMNFDSISRYHYSIVVTDIFKKLGQKNKYEYAVRVLEYNRMCFLNHIENNVEAIGLSNRFDEYIASKSKELYPDKLLNYQTKRGEGEIHGWRCFRKIASLPQSDDGIKKQVIGSFSMNKMYAPISKTMITPYSPNLLKNGDFESLYSPEESFEILKKHIKSYSDFFQFDDNYRIPEHIYFYSDSSLSSCADFNSLNTSPIDGNYSAKIRFLDGGAYLLFFQKYYTNGEYEYSMLVQGETGTRVTMLYDYYNGKWNTIPIVSFSLPDKRLYRITSHFSIENMKENQFFLIGVSQQKGEAVFDNLTLRLKDVD